MSAHRFFLAAPLQTDSGGRGVAHLSPQDLHHLKDVVRVHPGELLELVDPEGGPVWETTLLTVDREHVSVSVQSSRPPEHGPRVTLVQGLAKGEKMDAIVRQAVEVGAEGIVPVVTKRTVVRLDERRRAERTERWRRIARAAAEQSHRDELPDVAEVTDLTGFGTRLADFDRVLVLWEEEHAATLAEALESETLGGHAPVALVVGPEGGLDADEVAWLVEQGARRVTLGPSILRTETAAVVGLALVISGLGGLGASRE